MSMTLPNDLARDRAVERWLGGQVGPAYDALKADTSRAETAERIRARLTRSEEHTSELQSPVHLVCRRPPGSPLFPYTTLFRSLVTSQGGQWGRTRTS